MGQLKIFFKKGNERRLLQALELQVGKSYTGGRAEGCEILLPEERGLSRQHFQLTPDGEHWRMTVLSKYGSLTYNEGVVKELLIAESMEFAIPPLYFEYLQENRKVDSIDSTRSAGPSNYNLISLAPDEERTIVGYVPQIPLVRLLDENDIVIQVYQLEGDSWVAGRDTTCGIFIDSDKISRKHFEIRRQEHVFFVRDLGSANGTTLNGRGLRADDWQQLASGDLIRLGNCSLKFELRDAQYEDRLEQVQHLINSPAHIDSVYAGGLEQPSYYEPQSIRQDELPYDAPEPVKGFSPQLKNFGTLLLKKENRVRVAIGTILLLALSFSALDGGSDKKPSSRGLASDKGSKSNSDFSKLKPEQQDYVKQTHRLAKELIMQGRYEMARQEILKIHQFIQSYEDSAEIENTAVQGIQLQQEKARADAREREKVEIEEKITRQIEQCKTRINPNIDADEIDSCLAPVVQFNPEHPGIQALKSRVDQIVSERKIKEAQKADYAARAAKQKALYVKASDLNKAGQLLQAVKAFQEVSSSGLPDPQGFKAQAQRNIASIQQTLADRQAQFESQADVSYKKGELKEAILLLKKSEEINPDNEVTKSKVVGMLNELKKQMQTFYQEGILEESVGEVESAKTKWRKIIKLSLPDEEYYKKATIKLKKYGAL